MVAVAEQSAPGPTSGVVSLIGLAGSWIGTGSISCSAASACRFSSQFIMTEFDSVNEDVLDAMAELTNMIIGGFKTEVEDELGAMAGVKYVKANPTTGNVLIRYEPDKIRQGEIVENLRRTGWLALNNSYPYMATGMAPAHLDVQDLALRLGEKIDAALLEILFLRLLRLA